MDVLFWQIVSRSSETEFIFSLFHWLLASLALVVALGLRWRRTAEKLPVRDTVLVIGFILFCGAFGTLSVTSGADFFFHQSWSTLLVKRAYHVFLGAACLLTAGALITEHRSVERSNLLKYVFPAIAALCLASLVDAFREKGQILEVHEVHSPSMFLSDGVVALILVCWALDRARQGRGWSDPPMWALVLFSASYVMHLIPIVAGGPHSDPLRHAGQHLLSLGLFACAWTLGERSTSLFDRVFVRLNLTLIVLASVTILSTVGMQRFQYVKLAEERSLGLAEYLRGHMIYYASHGDSLETILQYPDVVRRIVVGFGEIPDFRRLDIQVGNERATFRYAQDQTVSKEFSTSLDSDFAVAPGMPDSQLGITLFRMLVLPIDPERESRERIEFFGTFESINRHIGGYIALIYILFTVMAAVGIVMVGLIVRSADRGIRQQQQEIEHVHRQLAQASKLASIGELAGGVAHEINNPVTSILSTASHLAGKHHRGKFTATDCEQLDLISEQAERISNIVGKLLTFSRKSRMELRLLDLNEVIHRAVGLIEFRLRSGIVTLEEDLYSYLPRVLGDPERLTEVLVNLMNNALDAMPAGGALMLRTLSQNGSILIEVSDTGPGIEPSVLERVFDPFFTTKEPGKGTGLGLSISHGIVSEHNGEITVESSRGAGVTFVVRLPAHS